MRRHNFRLVDLERFRLFGEIARGRSFLEGGETFVDDDGIAWRWAGLGSSAFGITYLGPGLVWSEDLPADDERAKKFSRRRTKMQSVSNLKEHVGEFNKLLSRLRFGGITRRLVWAIHTAVIERRSSSLLLADRWLASMIWGQGRDRLPAHWRKSILAGLRTLTWIHVAPTANDGSRPRFGAKSVLLEFAADLRGHPHNCCDGQCGTADTRHHHFRVEVGPAFLGLLEQFGRPTEEDGIRSYEFRVRGKKGDKSPTLQSMGRTGQLVNAFIPAVLGDPTKCSALTESQHGLLQAMVRETTRGGTRPAEEPATFVGNRVPGYSGRREVLVADLSAAKEYVSFNGNGHRTGRGYRLTTPGGWCAKAGYSLDAADVFLADAAVLADLLDIVWIGVAPNNEVHSLGRMRAMTASPRGRKALSELHVRAYVEAGFAERWAAYFGWPPAAPKEADSSSDILAALGNHAISRKVLAATMRVDASLLSKVFLGKKPWPAGWIERAREAIISLTGPRDEPGGNRAKPGKSSPKSTLDAALDYAARGWSVVPQRPGEKQPCVKWKPFQTERPDTMKIREWWDQWPDAGVALVLGPVSGVICVDVDGPEAHAALVAKLGYEPLAPMSISGSGKPHRYHLFFRHPTVSTKAKQTPWHPQLEFRGHGGIVIVPPSVHKSGNKYAWAEGRSPDDVSLPELPSAILAALTNRSAATKYTSGNSAALSVPKNLVAAASTLKFLSGKYADDENWNARLFRASCDLCGRGYPLSQAEPLLLAAAAPWDATEADKAKATIRSAFSSPRKPGEK